MATSPVKYTGVVHLETIIPLRLSQNNFILKSYLTTEILSHTCIYFDGNSPCIFLLHCHLEIFFHYIELIQTSDMYFL